jgi:hypothetical protein
MIMHNFASSLEDYLRQLPPLVWLIILAVAGILLVLIWRSGWRFKSLKKVRVGPVEAERFEPSTTNTTPPKEASAATVGDSNIQVQVKDSTFHDKVGDIGGVIIKGDPGKSRNKR